MRKLKNPVLEHRVVIHGMLEIIEKDLKKAKQVKEFAVKDRESWKIAISHEVRKKRAYRKLIGGEKYDDNALKNSISQMNQNLNHLNRKVTTADQKIDFQDNIINTLTKNYKEHKEALEEFAKMN